MLFAPVASSLPQVSILFVLVLLCGEAISNDLVITNIQELIELSNNVSKGDTYSNSTIYLDADLDFSDPFSSQFYPIGKSVIFPFKGTFDGQGHTIRNLTLNSSHQYTGLFGYSNGATIRNIIIDHSCSFEGSLNSSCTGSLVGLCRSCTIENVVNMANVTSRNIYTGGVIGFMSDRSSIKNTANYGIVIHYNSKETYVGGIVGRFHVHDGYIFNCINGGSIHIKQIRNSIHIGGVVGSGQNTAIRNCVNTGTIIQIDDNQIANGTTGGIIGSSLNISIVNCYWDKEITSVACSDLTESTISRSSSYDHTFFELDEIISIGKYTGKSLLSALNAFADMHYIYNNYSHWVLNTNNNEISFIVNDRKNVFTLSSQLILLPNLALGGYKYNFDGWYTDKTCTMPLTNFEVTGSTSLYSKWVESVNMPRYTVSFDVRGGTPIQSKELNYLSTVRLPKSTSRGSCDFLFWSDDYGKIVSWDFVVPAHNVTLHAMWVCTHIRTAEELIAFAKSVNSGSNYNSTTVILDSDIDFSGGLSENFETIGNDWGSCFFGTFDGQGYVIKNLKMSTFSQFVGLFGYTREATLKNVIIDSSCTIETFLEKRDIGIVYVGAVAGNCKTNLWPCTIRNNVNMAELTFSTNTHIFDMSVGGIIGYVEPVLGMVSIKNCANYGDISCSSFKSKSYVGGIAGYFNAYSSLAVYSIKNCINYGNIVYDSVPYNDVFIGGIIGFGMNVEIENCVSSGGIFSIKTDTAEGSIVGYGDNVEVSWCYWNSTLYNESTSAVGKGLSLSINNVSMFNEKLILENSVFIEDCKYRTLFEAVNAFTDLNSRGNFYSKWILNNNRKKVSFVINNRITPFVTLTSDLIILPNLADGGDMEFFGWYTNENYTKPLKEMKIKRGSTLYGKFAEAHNKDHSVVFYLSITIACAVIFVVIVSVIIVVAIRKRFKTKPIDFMEQSPLIGSINDDLIYSN